MARIRREIVAKKLRVPRSLRYYEHIIRDDNDTNRIYNYIEANPAGWSTDDENPRQTEMTPFTESTIGA